MKDMKWIKQGKFAHRGLHDEKLPENSLGAFKNAISHNYDIELDIRMTQDNQIVVVHDSNLKRLCNKNVIIEKTKYSEIKKLTLLETDEKIPLLTDVLDILPRSTNLLIELKSSKKYKVMINKLIDIMGSYSNKYAIHSFDPRILIRFKKVNPLIIRGQISKKYSCIKLVYGPLLTHLAFNIFSRPDFINYNIKNLPKKQLDRLKNKGILILSYTARTEHEYSFVKDRYDNAVFEKIRP
ncbi:hypothetical protein CI105_07190 [Candidatus Izimaplasma bacterium ZiA1]|uniref:glycerophosphodiester phosphodiesterase family protein n=1 Tax=Candidatus Izimoplasma sp. ZiA1 TaxID=2024899 RepID=UPI000BAA3AAD|nr:hypothetical protein CI105_07190 [Candidatus Izimaplasma bacterium ZiA1]